jgi:hypothetical protein
MDDLIWGHVRLQSIPTAYSALIIIVISEAEEPKNHSAIY